VFPEGEVQELRTRRDDYPKRRRSEFLPVDELETDVQHPDSQEGVERDRWVARRRLATHSHNDQRDGYRPSDRFRINSPRFPNYLRALLIRLFSADRPLDLHATLIDLHPLAQGRLLLW